MMANIHPFRDTGGAAVVSTADGDVFTDIISPNEQAEVYIEFFSDASGNTPVTPTGGTLTFYGSPLGNVYLDASSNGTVPAPDVQHTGTALYTPPILDGLVSRAKCTMSGITGADYMRAVLYSHAG